MGKDLLTPTQNKVLELAATDGEITRWYYFTGGTALSVYYLHHRYSEDLDFFTRSQVNKAYFDAFFEKQKKAVGYVRWSRQVFSGLVMYTLEFPDASILKIDLNEYDFPLIEKGEVDGKLQIDSLYDIAINKLYSITGRIKARDFVDLYVCIEKEGYFIDQLASRIPDKFGISLQPMEIAQKFLNAKDLLEYPKMTIPFDREKMVDFYLAEAKKLGSKIFK